MTYLPWFKYALCGDWHLHTDWTDGQSSIRGVFDQAEKNELSFILFSEHVRRDLSYDYKAFKDAVYAEGESRAIKFAVGAEAKVLTEQGDLDISEDVIEQADIISFAFHTPFFKSSDSYKAALFSVVRTGIAHIWAHPTSYPSRMGFDLSMDDKMMLFDAMKQYNVAYELNKRYPADCPENLLCLVEGDVCIVCGSDAHRSEDMLTGNMCNIFNNKLCKDNALHFQEMIHAYYC